MRQRIFFTTSFVSPPNKTGTIYLPKIPNQEAADTLYLQSKGCIGCGNPIWHPKVDEEIKCLCEGREWCLSTGQVECLEAIGVPDNGDNIIFGTVKEVLEKMNALEFLAGRPLII